MSNLNNPNLSPENRERYLKIAREVKQKLPHGAVAEVAKRHPEILKKHFYRVLDKKNPRIDLTILNLLRAEADKHSPEQEKIAIQLQ